MKQQKLLQPQITKVAVTIEGLPNAFYSQRMRAFQKWDEIQKHFMAGSKCHRKVAMAAKDLGSRTSPSLTTSLQNILSGSTCGRLTTTASTAPVVGWRTPRKGSRHKYKKHGRQLDPSTYICLLLPMDGLNPEIGRLCGNSVLSYR